MNSFAQFITVLLIFIIVLIVTYAVTKWIGGIQKSQSRSGSIEVIESARIAPGVFIEIVRIGQKYVALSPYLGTQATEFIQSTLAWTDVWTALNPHGRKAMTATKPRPMRSLRPVLPRGPMKAA